MLTARHVIQCLLISCLGVASAIAQPDLSTRISMNVIGGRLEYVLQEIGKTADVEVLKRSTFPKMFPYKKQMPPWLKSSMNW